MSSTVHSPLEVGKEQNQNDRSLSVSGNISEEASQKEKKTDEEVVW